MSESAFYPGAAITHIPELRRAGTTAIKNAGAILPDLLTPATVLSWLWARGRSRVSS